jgi:DNA-directed RNA polymerase specialized sigma24 family protein
MRGGRKASSCDVFFYSKRASLVRQAYVLTGDLHLAQDLAQETLVRAWASWGRVE